MSHNTFGHLFRVTTWGESHGPALGCVVDGCPPGIRFTRKDIQDELDRPDSCARLEREQLVARGGAPRLERLEDCDGVITPVPEQVGLGRQRLTRDHRG